MFNENTLLSHEGIILLLEFSQVLALAPFMGYWNGFTSIEFIKAQESQVTFDMNIFKPVFVWREFKFKDAEIMGSAYPAGADECDAFALRRKDERLKGVSFFFPL